MRSIPRTLAIGVVAGALLLSGCGSDDEGSSSDTEETTTTAAEQAAFEITDVWARQSPMGTTAGAVYLNLTAAEDDALVGASVPAEVAGTVEIHETVMADDSSMDGEGSMEETTTTEAMGETTETTMAESTETTMGEGEGEGEGMGSMTMQPVDSIELPAGETVSLEPGGYHIMLLDLVEPLEVGDSIEVTLTFESGATQTVTAEVREG